MTRLVKYEIFVPQSQDDEFMDFADSSDIRYRFIDFVEPDRLGMIPGASDD
jgi:hypothetical protein